MSRGRLASVMLFLYLIFLFAIFFSSGLILLLTESLAGADATKFIFKNNCPDTIWPASLGGNAQLSKTGFELASAASETLDAPPSWSGRIWARTGCSTDPTTGKFSCQTGYCGNSECASAGGAPPTTLVELTLGATDFYDISLVDGFNLPVAIAPASQGGAANCTAPECKRNVLKHCPADQATKGLNGDVVGCLSACNVYQTPEYCCNGAHATPETCPPNSRSKIFKSLCPQAYSYAHDDRTSTFTCPGQPDYVVTFCP